MERGISGVKASQSCRLRVDNRPYPGTVRHHFRKSTDTGMPAHLFQDNGKHHYLYRKSEYP